MHESFAHNAFLAAKPGEVNAEGLGPIKISPHVVHLPQFL